MNPEETFWAGLKLASEAIEPAKPAEFRAYYYDSGIMIGRVKFFTGSDFPADGMWISISADEYKLDSNMFEVVDNRLQKIAPKKRKGFPLIKGEGNFKTVKNHAGIIVEEDDHYNDDVESYGRRS